MFVISKKLLRIKSIQQVLAHLANQKASTTNLHEQSKAIFDDTTYQDLNVFCGQKESYATSLFNLIDHTQTIAGRAALLNMLYNPLSDIKSLRMRQAGIRNLVENEELYASILEKLETIKSTEHTLFLILNEIHFELISTIADRFYLKSVFDIPGISMVTSIPFVGMIRLIDKLPLMKKFNTYVCNKLNKKQSLLEIARLENYFNTVVIMPAAFLGFAAYLANNTYSGAVNQNYFQAAKNATGVATTLIATWFMTKTLYTTTVDNLKTENMLHEAVGKLAKMTTALRELKDIVEPHSKLTKIISLKNFEKTESEGNTELENLLVLFENENFKKPATWKTPKGKMMAALKLLCTLRCHFLEAFLKAGELDAIMSAATLYKKHATHPNANYQFANYEEQETPHLVLNDFWNPFINPDIVITNSLELGTNTAHRNVLITEPNAGGKSTALKAVSFAVLLAQTLTIANANITLTPFSKVFTTLNITDTTGKSSLYQADKNRIKDVTSTLENLDNNEKALLISDEMFNSTGASYGAALFYGTLSYIDGVLKNTLFAAATHFEDLVELEEDTQGSVANFRVEEATVSTDGKLTWTYKIKSGFNKQNISFELAQEDGFDPKILTAATKLLKKHSPSTV